MTNMSKRRTFEPGRQIIFLLSSPQSLLLFTLSSLALAPYHVVFVIFLPFSLVLFLNVSMSNECLSKYSMLIKICHSVRFFEMIKVQWHIKGRPVSTILFAICTFMIRHGYYQTTTRLKVVAEVLHVFP